MTKYVLLQSLGFFILAIAAIALLFIILYTVSKKFKIARKIAIPLGVLAVGIFFCSFRLKFSPNQFKYPFFSENFRPGRWTGIAPEKCLHFFQKYQKF